MEISVIWSNGWRRIIIVGKRLILEREKATTKKIFVIFFDAGRDIPSKK
jgi:hypothetical protein